LTLFSAYATFTSMNIFSEHTILTVSRLTSLIKDLLEDNFCQVWIEGEVSNLATPASGHLYFTLKDSNAMLRCVMFRGSSKALKFCIKEGMALIVRGRLSVYDQRGEYQLVVEYAEPKGIGALQAAFMQLKERLAVEGLFDEAHKRPLPRMPQRVGVITSPSGAVIHDILTVLGRRNAGVELLIYPVKVQGEGAAGEIVTAITTLNRLNAVDVLIVGRGGGSLEDLWAFNEESVARAVYYSKIPVISAVGHETDWSICDFTADLRAATPSAAAELVCIGKEELVQQLGSLSHRLYQTIAGQMHARKLSLSGLQRALHDPSRLMGHMVQRVDDLTERLDRALKNRLLRRNEQFARYEQQLTSIHPALRINRLRQELLLLSEQAERRIVQQLDHLSREQGEATARLESLSPLHTLMRGFSVAERVADGKIVKHVAEIAAGEQLRLRLHQGSALCMVEKIYNDSGGKATT
jgi:exodeoxyribonuclease VII large subunit